MEIIKNVIISIVISLILLFALSMILALTDVKESFMGLGIIFISTFSILTGAFLASRKIKEKGIIYGALLGFIYMLILYIISSVASFNFAINLDALIMFGAGILGGAIGGILGVNLK